MGQWSSDLLIENNAYGHEFVRHLTETVSDRLLLRIVTWFTFVKENTFSRPCSHACSENVPNRNICKELESALHPQ